MGGVPDGHDVALVLSGGNALGAYQAGAYAALHAAGIEPHRVAGASIGAVNGAILCGNPRDGRVAQLDGFWRPASGPLLSPAADEARRTAAASWTLATGRSDLFVPRNLLGPWWNPFGGGEPSSLYDAHPLAGTLERIVDFDRLNTGAPRYAATMVDVETGEDVVFDTRHHRIGAEHVRASAALLPAFAPVEIGGRMLGDAGISANLPIDTVLGDVGERPLVVIAIDLLPLRGRRPRDLGEVVLRMQDLVFATQSRRAIAAWQAILDARAAAGGGASVTLLHIAYVDQAREVSGKAFDYSPESVAARWEAGEDDMVAALDVLDAIDTGRPGLSVHSGGGGAMAPVRWPLAPVVG